MTQSDPMRNNNEQRNNGVLRVLALHHY